MATLGDIAEAGMNWKDNVFPILTDFAVSHHSIVEMIGALGYAMGLFTILSAIFRLKRIGEDRASGESTITGIFIILAAGICMLHLPSVLSVGTTTMFGDSPDTAFAYSTNTGAGNSLTQWTRFILEIASGIIQAVGLIAILSALMHFKAMGEGQKKQSGKGWWHLTGGVLAWNIAYVASFLQSALGLFMMF